MDSYFSWILEIVRHVFLYCFNCLLFGQDDIAIVIEMGWFSKKSDIMNVISKWVALNVRVVAFKQQEKYRVGNQKNYLWTVIVV